MHFGVPVSSTDPESWGMAGGPVPAPHAEEASGRFLGALCMAHGRNQFQFSKNYKLVNPAPVQSDKEKRGSVCVLGTRSHMDMGYIHGAHSPRTEEL